MIRKTLSKLRNSFYSRKYGKRNLVIGRHVSIKDCKLEDNVTIGRNSRLLNVEFCGNNMIMSNVAIINSLLGKYVKIESSVILKKVVIGDYSYIGDKCAICRTNIGKYCSIGPSLETSPGRHPTRSFVSTHPIFYSTLKQCGISYSDKEYFDEYSRIEIGNDVWIGAHAIVLDGVNINDGAIVGAGAVVTKNVPAFSVVGGIPAKVIRYRFDAETIEFLIEFKWWNRDPDWVRQNYKEFHNAETFVRKYRV